MLKAIDKIEQCVIMLFGGMPTMGHEFTMGKKDRVDSWKTSGNIEATDNQVHIKTWPSSIPRQRVSRCPLQS